MSKLTKIVTKPARMPLNWVLPRHVVGGVKEFKFSSSRYPLCPNCSMTRFVQKERPNEEGGVVWCCETCRFEAVTQHAGLDAIQEWCNANAKAIYDASDFQKERADDFNEGNNDGFIAINVKRNMLACYSFLGLGSIIGMVFIYAALTVNIFFMFNTLLFALGSLFMSLVFNYRAWQAATNHLYASDGKEQFHWWLSNHPWFQKPKDIGNPPEKQD